MKGRYFTGLSSYIAMAQLDVALQVLNAPVAIRISENMCKDSGNFSAFRA
jgi:hypothetical protein